MLIGAPPTTLSKSLSDNSLVCLVGKTSFTAASLVGDDRAGVLPLTLDCPGETCLSTVINADRIIVMDRGRIAQVGDYKALIDVPGIFQDLARRQML